MSLSLKPRVDRSHLYHIVSQVRSYLYMKCSIGKYMLFDKFDLLVREDQQQRLFHLEPDKLAQPAIFHS